MRTELIYLACPYSHADRYVRRARHMLVNKVAAKLMSEGLFIFSPISHTPPIEEVSNGKLPIGRDFWEKFDRQYLGVVKKIIVLRLPGWETSTGVQAEIKIGAELGIPVEYMDYDLEPSVEETVELMKNTEELCHSLEEIRQEIRQDTLKRT